MSENTAIDLARLTIDTEALAAVRQHGEILGGCNGRCQFLQVPCTSDAGYAERVRFHNWMIPRLSGDLGIAGALELI